jgi:asparagine synthetase B (glutamine-hydrolysing)
MAAAWQEARGRRQRPLWAVHEDEPETDRVRLPAMCGFAGEIRTDGGEVDLAAVGRMTAALEQRGPDDMGVWAIGRAALGHRRLSIIDPTTQAAQPMVDADLGLTVAFNGCIYNHRELRRQLESEGYRFFSTGDTEVVLKAYHRWGTAFVDHLQGMFACCVFERRPCRRCSPAVTWTPRSTWRRCTTS